MREKIPCENLEQNISESQNLHNVGIGRRRVDNSLTRTRRIVEYNQHLVKHLIQVRVLEMRVRPLDDKVEQHLRPIHLPVVNEMKRGKLVTTKK